MEAKKTPSADLTKKVGMFTNLGLAIAVGLTLAAFEYKSYDDSALKDLGDVSDSFDELIDVPITQQPPPPPPPPPMEQPVIQEIPDEVKIEEKIDVNFDVDVKEATVVKEVAIKEVVIEEEKADGDLVAVGQDEDQGKDSGDDESDESPRNLASLLRSGSSARVLVHGSPCCFSSTVLVRMGNETSEVAETDFMHRIIGRHGSGQRKF